MSREIREPFDCTEAQKHLTLHAGNDLEPESAAAVEDHLARCEPCRGELERTRRSRERLAVLGDATAREVRAALDDRSADLWPALSRRLAPERSPQERAPREGMPREGMPRERELSAATAAAPRRRVRLALVGLPLAAAAALLVTLRFTDGDAPALDGGRSPSLVSEDSSPAHPGTATPAPRGVSTSGGELAGGTLTEPAAGAGLLRRAGPDDERLRDSSLPFGMLRTRPLAGAGADANSLASDAQLR